ncbi:MAG: arsinothricin resistance N-acetyltransferase ArsN1 family A [Gammaproteobacteria bacterium]|nr:arsinothricin resistance N-acetyltransferase ArsN1 family A [Gammaproteobacteria bacterium]
MSAPAAGAARLIRPAVAADAAAICRIYNEGIEDRVATLETRLRTREEQAEWLAARDPRHPVLVAEDAQAVIGWASLNVFNPRAAYDHVCDFSIYVARAQRGRGVGRELLEHLTRRAREIGYHKMVLAMFPWNTQGVALYRRMGFRDVGTYREQGLLDGKWVDILVMEKLL